jgi:hypothetical protein
MISKAALFILKCLVFKKLFERFAFKKHFEIKMLPA